MDGTLSHGRFNTYPTDILGEIAEHMVEDTRSLHSFARLCQSTVAVSRTVLFRDCYVEIGQTRHPLAAFIEVLHGQNNIAWSIHAMRLGSDSTDGYERTPVTLHEVARLLHALPQVRRLWLYTLEWVPSPHSLFLEYEHTSLRHLKLDSIECNSPRESPFELLRVCSQWASVNVKDLQSAQETTFMQTGPHKADRLMLTWFPFTGDWRLGIPKAAEALTELKHIEITDVVDEVTGLLKELVEGNKATLKALTIELCPIFTGGCYADRNRFNKLTGRQWPGTGRFPPFAPSSGSARSCNTWP
ncbi:hypothetical protein EIP86_003281 [Pleurotus ostreatoroseus]|nr:hypothetical protein EIP86_003281 [Pleurotus ostreatoroseus]